MVRAWGAAMLRPYREKEQTQEHSPLEAPLEDRGKRGKQAVLRGSGLAAVQNSQDAEMVRAGGARLRRVLRPYG